ncbi:MAG: N-acetylmuramic acid 6-phosphate etherase [Phycisphaerales bacterium]|nr:N-acetylmuramic acid 6-phosphate etherase [Phycisphaerales bacterium]
MTTLPPDRSHIATEQRHPGSGDLHALSIADCVGLFDRVNREVLDAMDAARPALTAFIEALEPRFARGGRLIYLGAGTSGRLGVLDASECPPTFQLPPGRIIGIIAGGDSALRISSEGKEDDPEGAKPELDRLALTADDTVVGIAAGGTTPYVVGAMELAKARGCLTAMLVCSPVARPAAADHLIVLNTGPELLTGSTRLKAGTATKLALNTISTTLMIRSGRVYKNLMVDVKASNAKLRDRAARIVSTLTGLDRAAALELVDRAGGSVKTAVVMQIRKVARDEAERLLTIAEGRLERVVG